MAKYDSPSKKAEYVRRALAGPSSRHVLEQLWDAIIWVLRNPSGELVRIVRYHASAILAVLSLRVRDRTFSCVLHYRLLLYSKQLPHIEDF